MKHIKSALYPVNLDAPNKSIILKVLTMSQENDWSLSFAFINSQQAGYRIATVTEDDARAKLSEIIGLEFDLSTVNILVGKGSSIGKSVKELLESNPADIIIVGHKHRNHFLGSLLHTADEDIIDWVDVPVLVLPEV